MGYVRSQEFCSQGNIYPKMYLIQSLQMPKPIDMSVKRRPTNQFLEVEGILEVHSLKSFQAVQVRGI